MDWFIARSFQGSAPSHMIDTRFKTFLLVVTIFLISCNDDAHHNQATIESRLLQLPGYENSNPSIVYLPETLGEISGMIYYAKDSSIICINDNEGVLYKFSLYDQRRLQRWPFSSGQDFEEIILHDSTFFALQSNGSITRLKATPTGFVKSIYKSTSNINFREFEAAVYDSVNRRVLLVCKDCEDDSTNTTSVRIYDTQADSLLSSPAFIIDHLAIEQILGTPIEKFKPSAAGVHPVTGDYYLISAINDLLVVIDTSGKVKNSCVIDKILFKQPEGLCFMPNGDLLISNEFAEQGRANILLYKYQPGTIK